MFFFFNLTIISLNALLLSLHRNIVIIISVIESSRNKIMIWNGYGKWWYGKYWRNVSRRLDTEGVTCQIYHNRSFSVSLPSCNAHKSCRAFKIEKNVHSNSHSPFSTVSLVQNKIIFVFLTLKAHWRSAGTPSIF